MEDLPDHSYDWRALSVRQPFASMIVSGEKRIENRSQRQFKDRLWRKRWIVIHASSGGNSLLPKGCLLGIAKIGNVFQGRDQVLNEYDREWAHASTACLSFDTIIRLHYPIAVTGALGPWSLQPSLEWKCEKEKYLQKSRSRNCAFELMMDQIKFGDVSVTYQRVSLENKCVLGSCSESITFGSSQT
jgi:hypothetical protein